MDYTTSDDASHFCTKYTTTTNSLFAWNGILLFEKKDVPLIGPKNDVQ